MAATYLRPLMAATFNMKSLSSRFVIKQHSSVSSSSRFLLGFFDDDDKEGNAIRDLADLLKKKPSTDPEIEALTESLLSEKLLMIRNLSQSEAIVHLVESGWKGSVVAYHRLGGDFEDFSEAIRKLHKSVGVNRVKILPELDVVSDPPVNEPTPADPDLDVDLLVSEYFRPKPAVHGRRFRGINLGAWLHYTRRARRLKEAREAEAVQPAPPLVSAQASFETTADDLLCYGRGAKRPKVEAAVQPSPEYLKKLIREVIIEEFGGSLGSLQQPPPTTTTATMTNPPQNTSAAE